MKLISSVLPLLLVGCGSRPALPPGVVVPAATTGKATDARIGAQVGYYTLGAYVDPDNSLIRHDAHAIQRLEREARWDLRPLAGLPLSAAPTPVPAGPPPPVDVQPQETPAPAEAPSDQPVPLSEPPRGPDPRAESTPKPLPEIPALVPNADGLIDLTAAETQPDSGNPFAVRAPAPAGTREATLAVGGVVQGASACALINGRLYEPGDFVESFRIIRVEENSVLLQHDGKFVRLPVSGTPTRLRIAL